jgi:hypothetical protein
MSSVTYPRQHAFGRSVVLWCAVALGLASVFGAWQFTRTGLAQGIAPAVWQSLCYTVGKAKIAQAIGVPLSPNAPDDTAAAPLHCPWCPESSTLVVGCPVASGALRSDLTHEPPFATPPGSVPRWPWLIAYSRAPPL